MKQLVLKSGKEKSLLNKHPWVYTGAEQGKSKAEVGELISITTIDKRPIAIGYLCSSGSIRARVLSFQPDEQIDISFFTNRLRVAFSLRYDYGLTYGDLPNISSSKPRAFRWVHGESDGLPGLIIDVYADYVVVAIATLGMEKLKPIIVDALKTLGVKNIYEKSDSDGRRHEGLASEIGVLLGNQPPHDLIIQENDLQFYVDIIHGQKTGFYLDQRENRRQFAAFLKNFIMVHNRPLKILNMFSYTGAFGLYAASVDPRIEITHVDANGLALEIAKQNMKINNLTNSVQYIEAKSQHFLRQCREQGNLFDVIVLDPPKFASTHSDVNQSLKGYKDINLQALQLLPVGGFLWTFSCSSAITMDLLKKSVSFAAKDIQRQLQFVGHLHQSSDHPIYNTFPEGEYLKGVVIRA